MFIIIVGLQSALIYYHCFSPFERESNWLAVARGAKPAPRFWAVALLDLCTALLLALLARSFLPVASTFQLLAQMVWMVVAGVGLAALFAIEHHFVNDAVAHFPNPGAVTRRLGAALGVGVLLTGGVLFLCVYLASGTGFAGGAVEAAQITLANFIPAFLLGIFIFGLQALAYFLRVIPLAGPALQAAISTGLWLWWIQAIGVWVGKAVAGAVWPGLNGLEGAAAVITAIAAATLLAAWRLPGPQKHADGIEPPSLVAEAAPEMQVGIVVTEAGGLLSSEGLLVRVNRAPFLLTVSSTAGERLLEIDERSIRRELLLHNIVAIPILYTGNTLNFKWRAHSRQAGPVLNLRADSNALCITLQDARLRLSFHEQDVLRIQIEGRRDLLYRGLSLGFPIPADSHFLGFGQRFNRIDQRGKDLSCLVEEGGVGYAGLAPILKHIWGERGTFPNGEFCTGFPAPFALMEREQGASTGLFWNTYGPSWFKSAPAGSELPEARLMVAQGRIDLYLCAGPTPLDVIRQYTGLSGRPLVPPPWVMLPWKTRTGAMTEADVLEDIETYRALDIPLGQVGVENWQKVRGSYEFNPGNYPRLAGLVRQAHERGYRIQIWHFPYMNMGSKHYLEGIRGGYFLFNRVRLPYQQRIFHGIAAVIDYSNPEASRWHETIVQQAIYDRGFSGTMTDYAESIPPDCTFYNGQSGLTLRNAYPVMYCRAMQRAARGSLGEDYLIYPRAGYAGSQRYINAQFPGDQDTDWDEGDGLPAAVRAMLNVSMCGMAVNGSDIGGWFDALTPFTTKELFIRWAEVGANSPLMRAHGGVFGRNREPWKFDDETVDIYRKLSQEHVRLFPTLYSLACLANKTGRPIVIHPALLWPEQKELYQVEDAWMLGEALYVAPVIRQGATWREVILPPGEWWNLLEDKPFLGPARITVNAPLGTTPRFLRGGYPLPRFVNAFDTFDVGTEARVGRLNDDLEVWLYPGRRNAAFTLFDGSELDCEARAERIGQHSVQWKIFGPRKIP